MEFNQVVKDMQKNNYMYVAQNMYKFNLTAEQQEKIISFVLKGGVLV